MMVLRGGLWGKYSNSRDCFLAFYAIAKCHLFIRKPLDRPIVSGLPPPQEGAKSTLLVVSQKIMLLDRPIVFGLRIMLRKYLTTGSLGVEAIYSRRTFVRRNFASSYYLLSFPNAYRTIR
jgi:hypothetical protein